MTTAFTAEETRRRDEWQHKYARNALRDLMRVELLHQVPLLDTLDRVMDRSIAVDRLDLPRTAPALTPAEWIDAAGDRFVVSHLDVRANATK